MLHILGAWYLRGLGLNDTHVHILRIGDLIVVHLRMLERRAVHPDAELRFNEQASTVVYIDLSLGGHVEFVI